MRDLGFAFNDKDFSDRTLHLELVGDSSDSESDSEGSDTQNLHKKQKIGVSTEKGDAACGKNSNCSSTAVKVKTLHIVSAILAASSPFFFKLFKNGMRESQERNVTLRINASEKRAFMDMLNFVYTNTLKATSAADLLGVLMAADKYEVSSCMSYCIEALKKMHMSVESALLYLEIPPSVAEGEVVQSLIDDAKEYLVEHYADITNSGTKLQEEAMALPLSVIEKLLGSPGEVMSEEDVYKFIMKWGRARYPEPKERREILTNLVARFLYFPYLSMSTLREIQDSPDFDSKQVTKLILESLYLNVGIPYENDCKLPAAIGHPYIVRKYEDLPIKVVQLESRLFVYLSLTKTTCPSVVAEIRGRNSQEFFLGGQSFIFEVTAYEGSDQEYHFGLFVKRQAGKHGNCIFDYELGLLNDEYGEEDFKSIQKLGDCSLSVWERVGSANLFGVPWDDFVGRKSNEYFINGILHLRAQFTIKNSISSSSSDSNSSSDSHPLG